MKKTFLLIGLFLSAILVSAQWSDNIYQPLQLVPNGTNLYMNSFETGPDGTSWFLICNAVGPDEYDVEHMKYEYRLIALDKEGNKLFNDERGLLISSYANRSWTSVNKCLSVDRDGNAIVAFSDYRNSSPEKQYESYTAYKISPKGEFLWGEDGINLDNSNTYSLVTGMMIIQLEDGSYMLSWQHFDDNDISSISYQHISVDGQLLLDYEEALLTKAKTDYSTPILVNAGDNQAILVYLKGSNQDIYAKKLDFDGSSVWTEDTRIYRGGFGGIPVWTLLSAVPSGDGGVIVSWDDDRNFTNVNSPYMSYVKSDGSLGFVSEYGDIKLCYSGFDCRGVEIMADPLGDGFYAIFRQNGPSHTDFRLSIQKVSKTGELLFDENGIDLTVDLTEHVDAHTLQPAPEGNVAVFYQTSKTILETRSHLSVINPKNGALEKYIPLSKDYSLIFGLESWHNEANRFWTLYWEGDDFSGDKTNYYAQRISFDVLTGVENVGYNKFENIFSINQTLYVKAEQENLVSLSVYNVNGECVKYIADYYMSVGLNQLPLDLPAGVYMVNLLGDNINELAKVLIK